MLVLAALFAVDAAIIAKLESPYSGDRERGAYALGRLHDPSSYVDRAKVDQAVLGGATGQLRAAALRGLCDRAWPQGVSLAASDLVLRSLEDRDPATVAAAAECTERMERSRAIKVLATELDARRGEAYVLPLFAAAGRLAEPSLEEIATESAARLGVRLTGEALVLDAKRSRMLIALAALGADVEPTLAASIDEKKQDFTRDARANAIRAAGGDAEALTKLVETANEAADIVLRREAVELISLLPAVARETALPQLASRLDDDGGVRARLVRELSRAGGPEEMLVKAASDSQADLRLQALCALLDRGAISADTRAKLPKKDADPLVAAALKAIAAAPLPQPSATPTPIASPSPSPSSTPVEAVASPTPSPSPTPYRWRP